MPGSGKTDTRRGVDWCAWQGKRGCMSTKQGFAKAPGQIGGFPWLGPRVRLVTRVAPTTASVVHQEAKRAGLSVSEYLNRLLQQISATTDT